MFLQEYTIVNTTECMTSSQVVGTITLHSMGQKSGIPQSIWFFVNAGIADPDVLLRVSLWIQTWLPERHGAFSIVFQLLDSA